jgi:hypothetical protein
MERNVWVTLYMQAQTVFRLAPPDFFIFSFPLPVTYLKPAVILHLLTNLSGNSVVSPLLPRDDQSPLLAFFEASEVDKNGAAGSILQPTFTLNIHICHGDLNTSL